MPPGRATSRSVGARSAGARSAQLADLADHVLDGIAAGWLDVIDYGAIAKLRPEVLATLRARPSPAVPDRASTADRAAAPDGATQAQAG